MNDFKRRRAHETIQMPGWYKNVWLTSMCTAYYDYNLLYDTLRVCQYKYSVLSHQECIPLPSSILSLSKKSGFKEPKRGHLTLGFPRFGSKELVPRWGHFRPHLKRASLIAPNCIYT